MFLGGWSDSYNFFIREGGAGLEGTEEEDGGCPLGRRQGSGYGWAGRCGVEEGFLYLDISGSWETWLRLAGGFA